MWSIIVVSFISSQIVFTISLDAVSDAKIASVNVNKNVEIEEGPMELDSGKIGLKKVKRKARNHKAPKIIQEDQIKFTEVALCRGEGNCTSVNNKRLSCYFKFGPQHHLRLSPFKIEQLHLNPDVLMIHDVVNDREVVILKGLAKPELKPVFDHFGIKSFKYRIFQVAWLKDRSSETVSRISRRVPHFTDLSVQKTQPLKVVNYGIGGFYLPHYDQDHDRDEPSGKLLKGSRRLATVIFYLSEVPQGGAIIFLQLGLTVFPKKNAAIFWKNLLPSGNLDKRTLHAACPVLRGYKWMATKSMSA